MQELISDPSKIGAAWLTEALRRGGALPEGRVSEVGFAPIGHGKMGDNVRFELSYEGAPESAPGTIVAKLPAADPTARVNAATSGSYWKEVCFYRELAGRLPIRTPRCLYSAVDATKTDFILLLEDMAPAEPGDQVAGCEPEIAERALREAAKLHGPLWNDPALEKLEWVSQGLEQEHQLLQMILSHQFWPGFLERFGAHLNDEQRALGDLYVKEYARWALGYEGPRTLVHCDYRLENMLFATAAGGVPIAVVDWGSPARAGGLTDVAYFMGAGLETEARREHERELVETYRDELSHFGVALPADECWEMYRRATLHGILITVVGAMFTGVDERGDRMFIAMIQRHLQHGLDLGAGEFLA